MNGPRRPESPVGGDLASSQDGVPDGRRRSWRLPATTVSVTVLRRGLHDFLRGAALSDDERYDLLLAGCEAASNAIEHAEHPSEPFFDVVIEIGDDGVTIVVCDHGQWCDATPGTYRGRGLVMMRALVDTTVEALPKGTTVTMRSNRRAAREPSEVLPHYGAEAGPCPSSAVGGP